jgi:hypothetical protein
MEHITVAILVYQLVHLGLSARVLTTAVLGMYRVDTLSDSDNDAAMPAPNSDNEPKPTELTKCQSQKSPSDPGKPPDPAKATGSLCTGEVFSGSRNLSKSLARQGVADARTFDILDNPGHDISSPANANGITQELLDAKCGYTHFAIPCNTYSVARFPRLRSHAHPEGTPEALTCPRMSEQLRISSAITDNALDMANHLMAAGVAVSIENPTSSSLLDHLSFSVD